MNTTFFQQQEVTVKETVNFMEWLHTSFHYTVVPLHNNNDNNPLPFPRSYGQSTIRFFIWQLPDDADLISFWRSCMLFNYCIFISPAFTRNTIWLGVIWCRTICYWQTKYRSHSRGAHIQNSICIANLLKVSTRWWTTINKR